MFEKQIMKAEQAGNSAIYVRPPPRLYGHRADRLCVELRLTFNNGTGALADLTEAFFTGSKLKWNYRDNSPFIVDTPLAPAEWANQIMQRRWAGGLVQCDGGIQVAIGATETHSFYLDIDLAIPLAERPVDFSQDISELGALTFTPDMSNEAASLSLTNVEVIVTAYGKRTDALYSGSRLRISTQNSLAPISSDELALEGKLIALFIFTKDGTVPIASTVPQVKVGNQQLLETVDTNTLDVVKHLGASRWTLFPQRPSDGAPSADFPDDIGHLVMPEEGFRISALPGNKGDVVNVSYGSAPSASTGKHVYVLVELVPRQTCFKREIPGAVEMKREDFERYVEYPTIGAGILTDELKDVLPQVIRTPQVLQRIGC